MIELMEGTMYTINTFQTLFDNHCFLSGKKFIFSLLVLKIEFFQT